MPHTNTCISNRGLMPCEPKRELATPSEGPRHTKAIRSCGVQDLRSQQAHAKRPPWDRPASSASPSHALWPEHQGARHSVCMRWLCSVFAQWGCGVTCPVFCAPCLGLEDSVV